MLSWQSVPPCFLSDHSDVCQNQQAVAKTNSLMALFVLRKYLAVGETILLIMYSNAVFITETILIGKI